MIGIEIKWRRLNSITECRWRRRMRLRRIHHVRAVRSVAVIGSAVAANARPIVNVRMN